MLTSPITMRRPQRCFTLRPQLERHRELTTGSPAGWPKTDRGTNKSTTDWSVHQVNGLKVWSVVSAWIIEGVPE